MSSKSISFRDLKVAEELSHLNEVEMLYKRNDGIMQKVLEQVGFDCDHPVVYVPSKHRDMQGNIAIGFMAVGEVNINRSYIDSRLSDNTDRLIAAGYRDLSLAQEMLTLGSQNRSYSEFVDTEFTPENDDVVSYEKEDYEEDYEWVSQQIKQLEDVRDAIRGSMFAADGSLKTFEQYGESN